MQILTVRALLIFPTSYNSSTLLGCKLGQSGYDVKYDFDKNDVVDIPDFLLFVDVFGRSVETPPEPPIAGSIAEDRAGR